MGNKFFDFWKCQGNNSEKSSNQDKSDNEKKFKDPQKARATRFGIRFEKLTTDDIVILGIMAVVFAVWMLLANGLDPLFEFLQPHSIVIENPAVANETMEMNINLYSTTFGTQSNVTAYVTLITNSTYRAEQNITNYSDKYTLVFQNTYCGRIPEDRYTEVSPCALDLTIDEIKDDYTIIYKGDRPIIYTTEGGFDVSLIHTDGEEVNSTTSGRGFIQIDSLELTMSFRDTKIIVSASIVAGIIAFLDIYLNHLRKKGDSNPPKSS